MNKHNTNRIHSLIVKRGAEIQDLLPSLPGHPKRIAAAHLYKEIKLRFGVPLADVRDCRYDDVIKLIDICCDFATDPSIGRRLTWIKPEPAKSTLEGWLNES